MKSEITGYGKDLYEAGKAVNTLCTLMGCTPDDWHEVFEHGAIHHINDDNPVIPMAIGLEVAESGTLSLLLLGRKNDCAGVIGHGLTVTEEGFYWNGGAYYDWKDGLGEAEEDFNALVKGVIWRLNGPLGMFPRQFDERDDILDPFFEGKDWYGGVRQFRGLDLKTLKLLIAKGHAETDDCQNCAPSIGDIVEVMERNPDLTAHGYAVERYRDDVRISIEGVDGLCNRDDAMLFRFADDFEYNTDTGVLYCWYD